jgi:hypothetical protein
LELQALPSRNRRKGEYGFAESEPTTEKNQGRIPEASRESSGGCEFSRRTIESTIFKTSLVLITQWQYQTGAYQHI